MRKIGRTGKYIKILSYIMAAMLAVLQPCGVMAAGLNQPAGPEQQTETEQSEDAGQQTEADQSEESDRQPGMDQSEGTEQQTEADPSAESVQMTSIKYIVAFEALAEEDAYFPCMYKPMSEELLGFFPETIWVWLDGEETSVELTVAWECEDDFDSIDQPYYLFYPKWDETQYALADSVKDSIEIPTITVEVPQSGGTIKNPEEAKSSLSHIIRKKPVLASIYLCDEYEVKAAPSPDSETVHTVVSGQSVQIMNVEEDEYGGIWYQVLFYQNGAEYTGYVERDYLATSDEDFTKWEEAYLDLSAIPMVMALSEGCPDIDQFPASYQNALYALWEKHPDWTFVRMDTGLDWNTAIANELGDKSWISSSKSGSWQNGSAPQRGWSYASEGILKYYMDPRNFLDDSHIFQFEQLTYNSSYHTTEAVQEMLAGSFMVSAIPDDGRTYAQVFAAIGQELGVSPFHLASRVLQEQGVRGSSALISGTYPGYEGYYNFFNISASGQGDAETIRRGLAKAKMEGWNTRYASLYGGAKIIGNQYILPGQNTLYLEKFNVANGKYANYTHQYMQNIEAPYYESSKIYKAYQKAGVLERPFVFKIPVYENMPASACAQPEKTDTITLDKTSASIEVDKSVTLIPYVNGSKVDHVNDMIFVSSNTSVAVVDAQGKVTAISPGDATISCTRSGADGANCTVTVVKANPVVSTPVLSPVTYREGIKLSDVALPSGWAWVSGDTALSVGTPVYAAVYTPTDTTKYNTITKNISFTVTKTVPVCQVPTGLEAKSGAALGSIVLPDGFLWESDTETVLTDVGEYTFYVSYNPDENNYYTVNHIPIIVQVKETVQEPSDGGNGGGNSGGTTGGSGSDSGSGTGMGSGNGSTSDGSTQPSVSAGSTVIGGTQPPTSMGGTATGGTQPPTSTGSTATGGTQPPTSTGSTATGGTQPPTSTGSTAAENIQSPVSSGNTSNENVQQENNAAGNEQSEETSAGGGTTGNTQQENASVNHTPTQNTPPETPTITAPAGNIQLPEAPAAGTTIENANNTNNTAINSGTAAANGSGILSTETSGSSEGEMENAGGQEEPGYFRPAVTIQMEDTTILTTEKMQMAKEQNFDLLLDMGGAVTWSIDVDSIDEGTMAEVDMGVKLGTNNVPQELISTILNGNKYLEITLAHQGEFDFEPVLNVALGKEYSGKYANLFYYNPETETLEFICDAIIGPDGVASLKFEHASCYLIIVSDQSMSGVSFDDETANPLTRRIVLGVFICMLLVVAGYGIFFFLKKKREEDYDGEEDENIEDEDKEDIEDDEDEEEDIEEEYDDDNDEEENAQKEILRQPLKENDAEVEDDGYFSEDDWIEDEDWNEPEANMKISGNTSADSPKEGDWFDDDEWNAEDDWIEDDDWVE